MRLAFLFFALTLALPLHATAGGLEEDVKRAEEQSRRERQNQERKESAQSGDNTFFNILVDLFRILWLINNTTTTYNEYPHAPLGFVKWAEWEDTNRDDRRWRTTGQKDHWFTLELQPQHMEGIGWGAGAVFRGHFWRFIGPYGETWQLTDGVDWQGGARVGLMLALFQSEVINLSIYGQGNFWFGNLNRRGGAFGLELRSYPFRPVTLLGRAGFQIFPAFAVGEVEAQLGFMLWGTELFAGWRYWSLQSTGGTVISTYSGLKGGIRIYF